MIDKQLLRLLGDNKKYIFYTVGLMVVGLFANIGITASICYAIYLAANYNTYGSSWTVFLIPILGAVVGIGVRYITSRLVGDLKDLLGKKAKKDLRAKVYDKILRLGVRSTDGMSMAGLTQVSMEGIEQLDLYYSSYIPQFFYAMTAPVILFGITVWIDWRVALVLLACVPLIPVSIIAVSKYAKKIFAKYWGKYTSMGDSFLDSVQGLRELKIFNADAAQHVKMNQSAEEFRKITMKVLVMQLASTTIMDLVAYGGAGIGISVAVLGVVNRGLSPIAALFLILVAVDFFLPLRAFQPPKEDATAIRCLAVWLSGSFLATGSHSNTSAITFSQTASAIGLLASDVYASKAWEKTSSPVFTVRDAGMVAVNAGSTIANSPFAIPLCMC